MAKDKKKKNKTEIPGAAAGTPNPATAGAAGQSFSAPVPPIAPIETGKKKKKKGKKGADALQTLAGPDISQLSPEQLSQMQLEEAIKESSNPAMKLKKLRSPLNLRSILLNLLFLILLTIVATFLFIWIFRVDKFDFGYVAKDMLSDFGITQAFTNFFRRLGNLFTGKGWTLSVLLTLLP